jgi:hypothetical protein
MDTPRQQNLKQPSSKREEFWKRHPALVYPTAIAIFLPLILLSEWLEQRLHVIWHSGGPKSYLVGVVTGLVLTQDIVSLWRRDWSQREVFWEFKVRRVWGYLFGAFMLFVWGILVVLVGNLQQRLVGGAVSLLIGFGYFKLRAIDRRKQRMQPSPWFPF